MGREIRVMPPAALAQHCPDADIDENTAILALASVAQ